MHRTIFQALAICILVSFLDSQAGAKNDPAAIYGAGTVKCDAFVKYARDKNFHETAGVVLSWVQGWMSSQNVKGRSYPLAKTVGGSLSADSIREFLVSECVEHPDELIFVAADNLYAFFSEKGL
jgi:hypothetical protein